MAELILSNAGRRYGRIEPPPLPPHRMLTRGLPPGAPLYRDFREKFCGPVKDQKNLGSCCGHAFASALEWINRAYLKRQPILSPLFLYIHDLIKNGTFPQDAGSDGVTGCQVAIEFGCCENILYPDQSQKIRLPSAQMNDQAKNFTMGAYHGITDSLTAISCLADPTPWPVEIGFTVYESFESNEVARTGVMPIPGPDEQVLGGHEVCGCGGYDIGDVPTIRPNGCPPAMLVQNSWSISWGLKGFFWCPLQILDAQGTDIKILHAGRPWL
jgi:Papain family cysteine protease